MKTPTGFKRGFGSPNYDPNKARQAQQAGQRVTRSLGKAHQWTSEQAIEAGRKGAARTAEILRTRKERRGQEAA